MSGFIGKPCNLGSSGTRNLDNKISATGMKKKKYITTYKIRYNKLKKMGFSNYKEFLNSKFWEIIKKWAYNSGMRVCQSCGTDRHLNYHHWKYNKMDRYTLDGISCFCWFCHQNIHKIADVENMSLKRATKVVAIGSKL